jgi:hypothetical protein
MRYLQANMSPDLGDCSYGMMKTLTTKRAHPQEDTSKLEGEIDQLVYQLYGLPEEEIEIVERKA